MAKTQCGRHRLAAAAFEVTLDLRSGEALAAREDARVKALALGRLIEELRGQLRAVTRDGHSLAQARGKMEDAGVE